MEGFLNNLCLDHVFDPLIDLDIIRFIFTEIDFRDAQELLQLALQSILSPDIHLCRILSNLEQFWELVEFHEALSLLDEDK